MLEPMRNDGNGPQKQRALPYEKLFLGLVSAIPPFYRQKFTIRAKFRAKCVLPQGTIVLKKKEYDYQDLSH